jgi:hypothetical protein
MPRLDTVAEPSRHEYKARVGPVHHDFSSLPDECHAALVQA